MGRRGLLIASTIALLAGPWFSAAANVGPTDAEPPASLVLIAGVIGTVPAYGCGVIVAEKRHAITVLTAAHNLQIARAEIVTVAGERLHVMATSLVAGHDLALLTVDRPWRGYGVARFASQAAVGTRVHVWGPIKNEPFTPQEAVVRELDPRLIDPPDGSFAIDCAACDHGDSGTGVFNARDELIGIVTSAYFADERRLFVLGERYRPGTSVASARP